MTPDENHHRPLMQLLVRLLGIFFAIDGIVGLVGNGIDLWQQFRVAREYDMPFSGGYALGWTIASAVALAAGLMLIFKSRIAMDALYHESLDKAAPTEGS